MSLFNSKYYDLELSKSFIDQEVKREGIDNRILEHICSSDMLNHMHKIFKRIKIFYLGRVLKRLKLKHPTPLYPWGNFGQVYTLKSNKNTNEYVFKISGQCKWNNSDGTPFPIWNNHDYNEVTLNKYIYDYNYRGLIGSNYVLKINSGIFVMCDNKKVKIHNYFGKDSEENILHVEILNYIKRFNTNIKLYIIAYIIQKWGSGETLADYLYNNPNKLHDLEFTIFLFKFIYEFLIISKHTIINKWRGICHNDLHANNILYNDDNKWSKYPFRVIDFGMSKEYNYVRCRDKIYLLEKLLIKFYYFDIFLKKKVRGIIDLTKDMHTDILIEYLKLFLEENNVII